MKAKELIVMLQELPDDAEVVVQEQGDDILGDYRFNELLSIEASDAILDRKSYHCTYSNYARGGTKVRVWLLK